MGDADIDWIPAGTRFTRDDMVHFQGKGERPLEEALPSIDLVITGPHASAALPEEVAGFVEPRFTKRLQYDFTDVSTSPVAKAWAAIDPHVLYIEDPHPRAVRDANRARPADLESTLREAFDRLAAEPEGTPSLAGVDAIRPVTFAYLPVYRRPRDDAEWRELIDALTGAGAGGIDEYERVRDQLIEQVVEAKLRRLATLDPSATTVAEWHSAQSLDVLSLHDTMNHTARPDGAICVERAPGDRLPNVVALSNRGEPDGSTLIRVVSVDQGRFGMPLVRSPRGFSVGSCGRGDGHHRGGARAPRTGGGNGCPGAGAGGDVDDLDDQRVRCGRRGRHHPGAGGAGGAAVERCRLRGRTRPVRGLDRRRVRAVPAGPPQPGRPVLTD